MAADSGNNQIGEQGSCPAEPPAGSLPSTSVLQSSVDSRSDLNFSVNDDEEPEVDGSDDYAYSSTETKPNSSDDSDSNSTDTESEHSRIYAELREYEGDEDLSPDGSQAEESECEEDRSWNMAEADKIRRRMLNDGESAIVNINRFVNYTNICRKFANKLAYGKLVRELDYSTSAELPEETKYYIVECNKGDFMFDDHRVLQATSLGESAEEVACDCHQCRIVQAESELLAARLEGARSEDELKKEYLPRIKTLKDEQRRSLRQAKLHAVPETKGSTTNDEA